MSDIIRLLPDSVANQIAAGEVIQRPASVLKELVENAVDAGAKTVNVIIVDSGRTSIQVIDDGNGMSETDARLSFERHATSKIKEASDLFSLHTMGFRGEALASIAAVAQVELTTRLTGDEIGTHLSISGSRIINQEPVSCPVGSNFLISNLFFNVPARRRFLKTNATELNNILTAFERIVLVNPQVTFTIHNNGVELLNLPSCSLRQRIIDVFGKRINQDLLPVDVNTSMVKITGFVGKPESSKKKGVHEYFFVNERFMKHPYFHKAVMNAYERMISEGEQVPYFIYFDVAPEDIDVNIHPTKTEVKFENEQAVWQILSAAVREAIGKFCDVPSIDFDMQGCPDIPLFNPEIKVEQPRTDINTSYNPFNSHSEHQQAVPKHWEDLYAGINENVGNQENSFFDTESDDENNKIIADKSPIHYQYKGKYIMTAVKSGLMIIDQQRAHTRILYDSYMSQLSSRNGNPQRVLFPEVVQFSAAEAVMVEKIMSELNDVGFELTNLGGNSFAVNSIPADVEGVNIISLLQTIVQTAIENGSEVREEINRSVALSLARNAAIPQGQVLSNEEMENVINQLFACTNVNYTPDGKSILCILQQQDIEHLFH